MAIPVPSRLTDKQIVACEAFARRVFGGPMFDHAPVHRGQHIGRNYPDCLRCLEVVAAEHDARQERASEIRRIRSIAQPWDRAAA